MIKFKDFLKVKEAEDTHPKFKLWREQIKEERGRGGSAVVFVERQPDLLGFKPAILNLHLMDRSGKLASSDWDEWDLDLNQALISCRVRARDKANEAVRSELALMAELSKIADRYGDGFFNGVLVEFVKDLDFSVRPGLADVLRFSTALEPNKKSPAYDECRTMIGGVLQREGLELKEKLGYSDDEASDIMADAITLYLDELFSVSNRKQLGLL